MLKLACTVVSVMALAGVLGLACSQGAVPAAPTTVEQEARVETAKTTPRQEWDKLVAEAKKEGMVVITTPNGPAVRDALTKAFKGKYGIDLQFILGMSVETAPKVVAERRAGIYSVDVYIDGAGSVIPVLGAEQALQSLDTVLQLPEVLDKNAWLGGDLAWLDPTTHFQAMFLAFPSQSLWVNADLVKAGEIKSYNDLLNPKWKGKISMRDPSMAGAGNGFFTFVAETLSNGLDYLRQLGKQEPAFTRDARLQTEWVARGKYPIAIGLKRDVVAEFIEAGAPIRPDPAAEGTYLTGEGGGIALISKAPHPKAAALLANWLLSKEGQTVAARAFGGQSARQDVPTDFLKPYEVRQPGIKYHDQVRGTEITKIKAGYTKVAREMYADWLK